MDTERDLKILRISLIMAGLFGSIIIIGYIILDSVGGSFLGGLNVYRNSFLKTLKYILLISGLWLTLIYTFMSLKIKNNTITTSRMTKILIALFCFIPGFYFLLGGIFYIYFYIFRSENILIYLQYLFLPVLVSTAFMLEIIGSVLANPHPNIIIFFSVPVIFGILVLIMGIASMRILGKSEITDTGKGMKISAGILAMGLVLVAISLVFAQPTYAILRYDVTVTADGNDTTFIIPAVEGVSTYSTAGNGSFEIVDADYLKESIVPDKTITQLIDSNPSAKMLKVATDGTLTLNVKKDVKISDSFDEDVFLRNHVSLIEGSNQDNFAWIYTSQNNCTINLRFWIEHTDFTEYKKSTEINAGWKNIKLDVKYINVD